MLAVFCGGDLGVWVFSLSNRGRKTYLWQAASRELVVFGIYFGNTCPRTFLEDSCHEQPAGFLNWRCQ